MIVTLNLKYKEALELVDHLPPKYREVVTKQINDEWKSIKELTPMFEPFIIKNQTTLEEREVMRVDLAKSYSPEEQTVVDINTKLKLVIKAGAYVWRRV